MNKWLIDIDSTTMATTERQLVLANQRFNTDYTIDHITEWYWEGFMPPDVCSFVWGDDVFHSHDFHRNCHTVENSIDTIKTIMALGDTVFFVSDRPDHLYEVTRGWLDFHGLREGALIFTDRETYPKAEAAKQFGLNIVVEDAPHNSVDLANSDHIDHVYLLDYPYNRSVPFHPKISRVRGWSEIHDRVLPKERQIA